jgi:hypothetical protein
MKYTKSTEVSKMINELKIECLNAAGLVKPDKAAFMETVKSLLTESDHRDEMRNTRKLIGQVLRYYQHWPRYRTRMHDLDWLAQTYDPHANNPRLGYMYRDGEWLFASDGQRIHKIKNDSGYTFPGVADMSAPGAPNFTSFFPALDQQRPLKLSDFRNVETDLLVWNGFTYLERYILEAFSGNRIMLTPESPHIEYNALLLKSEDGNRVACIAPLRS